MISYKQEKLELVITRNYYQKNKELLEWLAEIDERTGKALNFLKNHKFTWAKELIRNKKSLMEILKREYNKPENKECRSLILLVYFDLKKDLEILKKLQSENPDRYAI